MRIAFAQFYQNPTPVYEELASVLRSWGHTVWVGSLGPEGEMLWNDGKETFAIQKGPRHPGMFVRRFRYLTPLQHRLAYVSFVFRVKAFLRKSNIDIVQLNRPLYAFLFPLFMPANMRFVLDVRQIGEWDMDPLIGKYRNWRSVKRSSINARCFYDRALFASAAAATRVLGKDWMQWGSITPIGVSDQFLKYERPMRTSLNDGEPLKFIYVGSLTKLRRLEPLIEAARLLYQNTGRFRLVIIGPDHEDGYYHRLVEDLGVSNVVTILSPVPYNDVPAILCQHDIALAYVADVRDWKYQVTLKVLEYRALGMPIIASDNGPNREVVTHNVNGVLTANTPENIAEAMLRFISDKSFVQECTIQALKMRSGRTWQDVARLHLNEVYMKSAP